ncbi:MAG TPA: PilZ domain-containing protein [Pyrinomonadaceae bacterium]|nr:PilZ domain-containing protein [Pyrinomonadaceae bacterium]
MNSEGKSKRLRERIKLTLPVRVHCRESVDYEWVEMSRLIDVTPFGARFALVRPTERGRLLHLTLPMPRQLRCFDHVEDQYRVWALVRNVRMLTQAGAGERALTASFEVGAAFTGKHPPASYVREPSTLYDVDPISQGQNLWQLREVQKGQSAPRSTETRLQMAVNLRIEVFDAEGRVVASEETVTENISRRGAAVWTTLKVARGRFVRVSSAETGLSIMAVVRGSRTGPDGIPRLHMEFVDKQWPLEGIE